jgi:primosomal protein N'
LRADPRFEVLGPAPYPIARVNHEWRYRLAVRTKEPEALRDALRERILVPAVQVAGVRIAVAIDP